LDKYDTSPILFNLNSKHLAKEVLERFGDFTVGGQVICNVKYADDFMLLAKDETVIRDTMDRLI
jgi:Reverse transcriptase (RNA-dependent DNA polymerase).